MYNQYTCADRIFFHPKAELLSEDEYFNREEQCIERVECIKQVTSLIRTIMELNDVPFNVHP